VRRYNEAIKADGRKQMGLPCRQRVAQISAEPGSHVLTLHNLRKGWRLQGVVV
jgi:hypothetical protein